MRKVKVIETGDGELAIQLTDEEIKSLNWKIGDDIEWSETENGFKLTKVELNIMKKLSETYKKMGIAFTFPIVIKDANGNKTYYENSFDFWYKREYDAKGNQTYFEDSNGFWNKYEYDANGNETYYEDSEGDWWKYEYDAKGNQTYYEDSEGEKRGTPRSQSCAGKVIEVDGKKYKLTEL